MALVFYHSVATKCCRLNSTLLKSKRSKTFSLLKEAGRRPITTTVASSVKEEQIVKSVFISQSKDIFTNLALEDWLYKNLDFTHHHVMLLWRNEPCVVIGRHQNPWIEASSAGVSVARRNSGGGAVYHDEGNLNITFFSPAERYNRRQNLELLVASLKRGWNLKPEINKKEDIVIDSQFKMAQISGTASRLGRPNSYHHCTLLVDADKQRLSASLRTDEGICYQTTATRSAPSPTKNLSDVEPGLTMDGLMSAIGWEYLRTSPLSQEDRGWQHVSSQRGFQLVNPTDGWFPGLEKIRTDLESWEWRYGQTPKFIARKEYKLDGDGVERLSVGVEVERGVVGGVTLSLPPGVAWGQLTGEVDIVTTARGQRFSPDVFDLIEKAIRHQGVAFRPVHVSDTAIAI